MKNFKKMAFLTLVTITMVLFRFTHVVANNLTGISISNRDNKEHTYELYQILVGTIISDQKAFSLLEKGTSVNEITNLFSVYNDTNIKDLNALCSTLTKDTNAADFAEKLAKNNSWIGSSPTTCTGKNCVSFGNCAPGYYLVVDTTKDQNNNLVDYRAQPMLIAVYNESVEAEVKKSVNVSPTDSPNISTETVENEPVDVSPTDSNNISIEIVENESVSVSPTDSNNISAEITKPENKDKDLANMRRISVNQLASTAAGTAGLVCILNVAVNTSKKIGGAVEKVAKELWN